jgi:hypothetical protein
MPNDTSGPDITQSPSELYAAFNTRYRAKDSETLEPLSEIKIAA